jgi:hypothetical protein
VSKQRNDETNTHAPAHTHLVDFESYLSFFLSHIHPNTSFLYSSLFYREENLVNLELVVGDEGDFDDSGKGKGKSDKSGKGKSDDRRKLSKSDKSDKSGKGKSSAIEGSDSVSITADDVDGVIFDSERTAGGPRGTIDFCDGEITAADVFDANGNLVAAISNPPSPEPTDSFAPSITFSPTESPTGKGKSSKRSSSSDDSDDDRRARRQSRVRQLASATD